MERFNALLSQRTHRATRARYKLPVELRNAESMLFQAYKAEMIKRSSITTPVGIDSVTRAKISRIANWLTGDFKTGIILYGTVGSGKTTMANAICEVISIVHDSPYTSQSKSVRRISANKIIELKLAKSDDADEQFERLKSCEMLFVDDIGTEQASVKSWGNESTPIVDLLCHRYDRQLFTILTSNLDNDGLRAMYGERVADRINEMFDKLSYTENSYRK